MTAHEIAILLRDYAQRAEKRARENRYEHKRHEARELARGYRTAAEWVELMKVEESCK